MTPETDLFVDTMTEHWETTLGNQISKPLQQTWRQICATFNGQIQGKAIGQLQVLQPPTGTGKTQSIAVYCSMLSHLPTPLTPGKNRWGLTDGPYHPGILIVTRQISEADELAEQINSLAGKITARTFHSETHLSEQEMTEGAPILIITHAAYTNALRAKLKCDKVDSGYDGNWSRFNGWFHHKRRLVIIDEALDLVEHFKLDVEVAKQALAFIPDHVGAKFPRHIKYMNDLVKWLQELAVDNKSERMLPKDCLLSNSPDFADLRKAVKAIRLDRNVVRENNSGSNKRLHNTISETLDAIEIMVEQWSYFSMSGVRGTVNSARCLLPEGHNGAVIMDATASTNLLYQLFDSRVSVIPTPDGARRYDNVTLHVSTGHKVGKGYLTGNAKVECRKLISELEQSLDHAERVLIVCHKDVEPFLLDFEVKFSTLAVCHWGAIDGRNDWQDFDTVIVFGLPYLPSAWPANSYMAVQGPQHDDWFHANSNRKFGGYTDIREELKDGAMATNVVQAINRGRCRRVTDSEGNCAKTDVYILLPQDKTGDAVYQNILKAMPGIQPVKWSYSGADKKVRKSKYDASLIAFLGNQLPGTITATEIKSELGIPKTSFENLIKKIKDDASEVYAQLREIGVRYEVTGVGRGNKARFIKSHT